MRSLFAPMSDAISSSMTWLSRFVSLLMNMLAVTPALDFVGIAPVIVT